MSAIIYHQEKKKENFPLIHLEVKASVNQTSQQLVLS